MWTYSGNPASSNLDAVRFLVGDTQIHDPQLQNEEIAFELGEEGNVYKTASVCALQIGARYSRLVDKSVGDLRISYSQRQKSYEALSKQLATRSAQRFTQPYAGGLSISDKLIDQTNPDNVGPTFTRTQFDIPGSTLPNGELVDRTLIE